MKVLSGKLARSPSVLSSRRQPSLREYYSGRNRILINREIGGLGDILMHRMIFEDVKKTGVEVHFACPSQYHPAIQDHPFVDAILDCGEVNPYDYIASYNTTTSCGRYETAIAPKADLHRSDIWSKSCGIELTRHDMHIRLTDEEIRFGMEAILAIGGGKPTVAVCPLSAQTVKNLYNEQVVDVLHGISDMGMVPFGLHSNPIAEVYGSGYAMVSGVGIRQWMGVMAAVDYAITVDTSAFHLAGGLGKPTVGVFSFSNGRVYAQHFDKVEVVQGPCPIGHSGCYNWASCPVSEQVRKPCIDKITSAIILEAFRRLTRRFPLEPTDNNAD